MIALFPLMGKSIERCCCCTLDDTKAINAEGEDEGGVDETGVGAAKGTEEENSNKSAAGDVAVAAGGAKTPKKSSLGTCSLDGVGGTPPLLLLVLL